MEYASSWIPHNGEKYNEYLKGTCCSRYHLYTTLTCTTCLLQTGGIEYGYMNGSVLAWYQDVKDFFKLAYSSNQTDRETYTNTFRFINSAFH